jgi:hypothetical protein
MLASVKPAMTHLLSIWMMEMLVPLEMNVKPAPTLLLFAASHEQYHHPLQQNDRVQTHSPSLRIQVASSASECDDAGDYTASIAIKRSS